MTPEEKKANWQKAHDLHYLRHRARLSLADLGGALGVGDKELRKMERNKRVIEDQFMDRAEQAVRLLLAGSFDEDSYTPHQAGKLKA